MNPDAILNAAALIWRQIDETSVEVSMQTTGGIARVGLSLDQHGDVVGIAAEKSASLLVGSDDSPTTRSLASIGFLLEVKSRGITQKENLSIDAGTS